MTNETDSPRDRRRSPRARARIRVLFTREGAGVAIEAETDDISMDGVFVRCERRPPDLGTKLGLLLKFEECDQELMLRGVVARVGTSEAEGSESSPGMGIRFVDMDTDTRKALIRGLEGTGAYDALPPNEGGG